VYNFYTSVFEPQIPSKEHHTIKKVIKECKRDTSNLYCPSFGAGSNFYPENNLRVKDIAINSSVKYHYGRILFNLVSYKQPSNILELGTGLGISTLFMGLGNAESTIYTMEGCEEKTEYAQKLIFENGLENVHFVNGTFKNELPNVLDKMGQVDLVFIDGDHQYNSTLKYFEQVYPFIGNDTVVILDDLRWSKGMEKAWEEIKASKKVSVTLDIFQFGIVFFKKELSKQNFIIKF
jgi:predicted O-methyltransferase YrrM